jgi:uncharacterized protein
VEVEPEMVGRLMDPQVSEEVAKSLHRLGYTYVSVDLDGYRTGAMNEMLGGSTDLLSEAPPEA